MPEKGKKFKTINDLKKEGLTQLLNKRIESQEKIELILYEFNISKLTFKNFLLEKILKDGKPYYKPEELDSKKPTVKRIIKVGKKGGITIGKRLLDKYRESNDIVKGILDPGKNTQFALKEFKVIDEGKKVRITIESVD